MKPKVGKCSCAEPMAAKDATGVEQDPLEAATERVVEAAKKILWQECSIDHEELELALDAWRRLNTKS